MKKAGKATAEDIVLEPKVVLKSAKKGRGHADHMSDTSENRAVRLADDASPMSN